MLYFHRVVLGRKLESPTYTGECCDAFTGTSPNCCIWYFIIGNSSLSEQIIGVEVNLQGIQTVKMCRHNVINVKIKTRNLLFYEN